MQKKLIIILLVLTACSTTKQAANKTVQSSSQTIIGGKLFSLVFQQKAAEYKALCFQAYNLAHLRLDQSLQTTANKPKAIITDIDETVLDNSPYGVHQALTGKDYDQNEWFNWSNKVEADTVPGAPTFFKYAALKGVTVFYITNRDEKERHSTLLNLQKFGFPNADSLHFYPRQTTSSKETRRQQVMADYDVIMLLGDNLADFSALFDKKTMDQRSQNVIQNSALFGDRFIVLPNPNYGDWESSMYNYNYNLTPNQKDSIIRSVLKSY
jgi:5'-nucleotidase (lipoprotein e(P4) family)